MTANDPNEPHRGNRGSKNPKTNHEGGAPSAEGGRVLDIAGPCSELCHQLRRHEPHCEPNAKRNDQQVVEVAEDGDEVWNQIDRTEGIRGNRDGHDLCGPRHARIVRGQVEGEHVPLEPSRPFSQPVHYDGVGSDSNH